MLSTSVAHLENELTAREKRKGNDGLFNPIKERLQEVGRRLKTAALANIVLVEEDETDQCKFLSSYSRLISRADLYKPFALYSRYSRLASS